MIREDHRHTFHHTARIMLVALTFGMGAAAGFVLVDYLYHRGGFVTLILVFAALLLAPSAKAYARAVEEKSRTQCMVCEQ